MCADTFPRAHDHVFGATVTSTGERRTRWVVALTFAMMVVEVGAGLLYGSMALLADGWHMGTHAAAIGIAAYAYVFERRHARDRRYTFGPGKARALGGFASAVGLAAAAALVFFESAGRLASPVPIRFDEAIAVAVLGLAVNLASAFLLRHDEHDHEPEREPLVGHDASSSDHGVVHPHHDHNLRAAYLHVLADALTSVFALVALSAGKLAGWVWLDPMMGVVGALVIGRWSLGLLRDTAAVLLDAEVEPERLAAIRHAVEQGGDCTLADLHVWRIGPRHYAAILSVVGPEPCTPDAYRALLAEFSDLVHVTVEVNGSGRPA